MKMDSTYYRTPHSEKNILPGFSFDLHKRLFDIISWNYKAMYNAEIILEHAYLLFFTMKVTFENKGPVSKQMWSLPVGRKDARHLWFQQNHPYRKGPRSHEEPRHFHTTKEGGGGREQGALLEQPRVQTPQGARESGVRPGTRILAGVTSARLASHPPGWCHIRPELGGAARGLVKALPGWHRSCRPPRERPSSAASRAGERGGREISEIRTIFPQKTTILH